MLQAGITLVGTSSLLGGEGSSTHEISPQKMILGMGLIIASQVMHAVPACTSWSTHNASIMVYACIALQL